MLDVDALGYDELPYPCAPYPQSHPEHLATLARLMGLEFPDLTHARVLEIGCGDGANLVPLAFTMPRADLVGIDLSARQVAAGRATIHALALKNVQLCVKDLAELDDSDETFDYIIAHGVYSWTPPAVRDALVALFRRRLSPLGMGLISYNTLPGWSDRLALRHWLRETIGTTCKGTALVAEARRLIRKFVEVLEGDATPRGERLRQELHRLTEWSDGYLRHDLLEDFNEPVYFRQFVTHLAEHGLQFLAEADFPTMVGQGLPLKSAVGVQRLTRTTAEREQLFDLVTNREFRQSIVVHQERTIVSAISPRILEKLYVGSAMKASSSTGGNNSGSNSTLGQTHPTTFRIGSGFAVDVAEPFISICLNQLSDLWPGWMSFRELTEQSRQRLANQTGDSLSNVVFEGLCDQLATILLAGFAERAVELHTIPPSFSVNVLDRPVASSLARWQAGTTALVTNLRHDLVQLSASARTLLPLLDGSRDLNSLASEFPQFDTTIKYLARAALLLEKSEG